MESLLFFLYQSKKIFVNRLRKKERKKEKKKERKGQKTD